MDKIREFIEGRFTPGFNSKRVFNQGKSFDELFEIDGIPLFWFYKRYLLNHVLPQPINTYDAMQGMKRLSLVRKSLLQLSSLVLQKYIFLNEHRKIKKTPKKVEYTSSRKALFLTYFSHQGSDNRLYRIQGIIDQLSNDNRIKPFPLFMVPLSGSLPKQDHHALTTIYQYADETIFRKAKLEAKIFAERWKKIDASALNMALTLDTQQQLWPYFCYAFSMFMSREFLSTIFLYYEISKKIIEQEKVVLVFISGQTGLLERCMAAAARSKSVPCLLLPHGYTFKGIPPRDILDNMYLPVFNQTTQQTFITSGIPTRQVRVTGPAVYDTIVKYKRPRSKKKNNASSKNILLLTQPLVEDNLISEKKFLNMVRIIIIEIMRIDEVSLAIKLHPRERRLQKYTQIIRHLDGKMNRITLHQYGETDLLYHLLGKADLVVNFYATAGVLEASILDVPSITFPFDGQKNNKYGDFDPSVYVWEMESLKPAIEQLLHNPALLQEKRRKMVKEFCGVIDGKASERVVQWAYELLSPERAP